MGLDSVELVMEFEDRFGVEITDEDAQAMATPRDVTDYMCARLEVRNSSSCLRQHLFYQVRRALREHGDGRGRRITLDTKVSQLVPKKQWPLAWEALRPPTWGGRRPFGLLRSYRRRTMRDLVNFMALRDPRGAPPTTGPWTREQIALEVRRAVELIVDLPFYREDDRFVADMGIS